jgi:hypothetical protein
MMMITTGGKKCGLTSHPLSHFESEHVPIEREGALEIGYL